MYRLSSLILLVLLAYSVRGQSPHGSEMRINCSDCHTSDGWTKMRSDMVFDHGQTRFQLEGQHRKLDCKDCHTSLVFSEVALNCYECHTDVHQQTVGMDCARCHTANSWLVDDIVSLHQDNGFPLLGAHAFANCFDCHISESNLRFDRIGNDCINCHRSDYEGTTSPDHKANNFSLQCTECHDPNKLTWNTDIVDHSFFPLIKGHDIQDCARCHTTGSYQNTPNDCYACHQTDYNSALTPNHLKAGFPTDCKACHTIDPGWMPAIYAEHDGAYFPIYSGKHQGTWNQCSECHSNPDNYTEFTCTTCHANPETDQIHTTVTGYAYNSPSCLACHPSGSADDVFDHSKTNFPLTGAHLSVDCAQCHASGYAGTPTNCDACHLPHYNQSTNPSHTTLGLPLDCAACHTTDPDWQPALFPEHDNYYVLEGAHSLIAQNCVACHNGDYNNTPTTCVGCHQSDFSNAKDPDHVAAGFSTDCTLCHSQNAWQPSSFDHDGAYFPIYSGKHQGVWTQCTECHTTPGNFMEFNCTVCHLNPETDQNHQGVQGYTYNSPSCLACHPSGSADDVFDHNNTNFPLTGAHLSVDCAQCHASGYAGTPMNCDACHLPQYNQSTNPSHTALGLPLDCAACHTTNPDWQPALFPDHDSYYVLEGAHSLIAQNCAACHNGDYNNTPSTCVGCHQSDYNNAKDPDHLSAGFSTDCTLCHSQNAWQPSSFDHDGAYFPIYSGKHQGEWSQCTECHTTPGNYMEFSCTVCHLNPETDQDHQGIPGYNYNSPSCLACHPTGNALDGFDHNNTNFPLTGAHLSIDCAQCHANGYAGTPMNCDACHLTHYNGASNPNHTALGLPVDCAMCHTTSPGWSPAQFPDHNGVWMIDGAHIPIANDCAACHQGDYNNTPNTCVGCHQENYNNTANPNHINLGLSTDCAYCHTTNPDWQPAIFPDHNLYYVLEGAHALIANDCAACHSGDYNNTPTTCFGCHQTDYNQAQNPDHVAAQFSTDCTLCHNQNNWSPSTLDHDASYFPIYSGKHQGVWVQCNECHTTPGNYMEFSCTVCHLNPETDQNHQGIPGYNYNSTSCYACHPTGDANDAFNHNLTNFPLTGAHLTVDCAQCHANGYAGTPMNCDACHLPNYNAAANPNHIALGLSVDCASCHTTAPGWSPAQFPDHNNYWMIDGAHIPVTNDCAACHNGDYNNTPNTCAGCHQSDYNNAANPNHISLGLSTDCASCHTTAPGWSPAQFNDHNSYWLIDGAHIPVANDCAACHNGDYNNTPNTCVGCHQTDYNNSTNPGHVSLGLPTDCAMCHTTTPDWMPAAFPIHNDFWPLNGAHQSISNQCAACHNGNYNNTPNTCFGCHQNDYNNASNPNHVTNQFPQDCALCHSESAWSPASIDHNSFWPLTGGHAIIANDCNACHQGNYNDTPNTCQGCHTPAYNQSTNPNHQALGLPMDCVMCHTTDPDWMPASFPIHNDFWPLTGQHAVIANDCAACHNGNYNNTPNTCYGCHQAEYNATNNPDHQQAGFPTDCNACHNTTSWIPSTWDHDGNYFPIFSGKHEGEWNECIDCHTTPGNYTVFSCIDCHEHNDPGEVGDDHQGVPGYSYNSQACYSCHPQGED